MSLARRHPVVLRLGPIVLALLTPAVAHAEPFTPAQLTSPWSTPITVEFFNSADEPRPALKRVSVMPHAAVPVSDLSAPWFQPTVQSTATTFRRDVLPAYDPLNGEIISTSSSENASRKKQKSDTEAPGMVAPMMGGFPAGRLGGRRGTTSAAGLSLIADVQSSDAIVAMDGDGDGGGASDSGPAIVGGGGRTFSGGGGGGGEADETGLVVDVIHSPDSFHPNLAEPVGPSTFGLPALSDIGAPPVVAPPVPGMVPDEFLDRHLASPIPTDPMMEIQPIITVGDEIAAGKGPLGSGGGPGGLNSAEVPEPSTLVLLGAGLAGWRSARRRRTAAGGR